MQQNVLWFASMDFVACIINEILTAFVDEYVTLIIHSKWRQEPSKNMFWVVCPMNIIFITPLPLYVWVCIVHITVSFQQPRTPYFK